MHHSVQSKVAKSRVGDKMIVLVHHEVTWTFCTRGARKSALPVEKRVGKTCHVAFSCEGAPVGGHGTT